MDNEIEEDAVLDIITRLRDKKQRPDRTSIAKFAAKKHGLSAIATSSAIDRLLTKAVIYMKLNKTGNLSFFISKSNAECATQNDVINDSESHYDSENETNINEDTFEMRIIGVPVAALPNTPIMFERPGNETQGSPSLEHALNLSGIIARMASSNEELNKMLQYERSKVENLLIENFALKSKNQELQSKLENSLKSQEHSQSQDVAETIETSVIISNQRSMQNNEGNPRQRGKSNKEQTATIIKEQSIQRDQQTIPRGNKHHQTQKGYAGAQQQQNQQQQNKGKNSKRNNVSETTCNQKEKLKFTIVGDSQVKRLDQDKLSNSYRDVEVKGISGMRIQQAADTLGKTKSHIIIVHAATNDWSKSTPEKLAEEVLSTMQRRQENNKQAKIAYSSVFRRQDKGLNMKVIKLNKFLEDDLTLNGFDVIDNSNILFSNLCNDGLHINQGGIRKYASNLNKFLKFC